MTVDMKITFTGEEIREMVQKKVDAIETAVPGRFEVRGARYHSISDVEAVFVPAGEPEPEPVA